MSKKEFWKKLKKSLLVATAAVTGMTSSACNVKEEYNVDNVGFSPEVHDTIDSKPETDTVETSYDSSVTTGPSDNVDSTVYTTLENVDVPDDVVVTTVNESSEDVVTREAVTTKINGTVPHGKTIQDGGSGVQRRTEAPKTQESQNKPSTKSTAKVTTAKPVTTKKVTTKTTPKTTVTTAQPTTTVTTTTTELVTEPPVTEPIQQNDNFNPSLIGSNLGTFMNIGGTLYMDLLRNYGYNDCMVSIDLGYGSTFMGREGMFTTACLNIYNITNSSILPFAFSGYSVDELDLYRTFIYKFNNVQETFNGDIDYTKYTVDSDVGNFLNEADQAYRDGNFDNFMIDHIVNGNVGQNVLNNPGAMAILYSYDGGKYLNFDDIDNGITSCINDISMAVYGCGYSK